MSKYKDLILSLNTSLPLLLAGGKEPSLTEVMPSSRCLRQCAARETTTCPVW